MIQEKTKTHYSLAEAAGLAKCTPQDLLHYGVKNKIALVIGLPDGIELRVVDVMGNVVREPFLLQPQLLTLMQTYCLTIETNGKTEQSDFSDGSLIDSSGRLQRLPPNYGYRHLDPRWTVWRTYENGQVKKLALVPERLFVTHSELNRLINPGSVTREAETQKPSVPAEKNKRARVKLRKVGNPDKSAWLNGGVSKGLIGQDNSPGASAENELGKNGPREMALPEVPRPLAVIQSELAKKSTVILRLKQVTAKTGLPRSTVYDRLNPKSPRYDSTFPKQIALGQDTVGWVEAEIDAWIESQIDSARVEKNRR